MTEGERAQTLEVRDSSRTPEESAQNLHITSCCHKVEFEGFVLSEF